MKCIAAYTKTRSMMVSVDSLLRYSSAILCVIYQNEGSNIIIYMRIELLVWNIY